MRLIVSGPRFIVTMNNKVLVTGASGHIGGNLIRALIEKGIRPRVLIHQGDRALEGLDIERAVGDVADIESLRKMFEGVGTVYHLAAVISLQASTDARLEEVNVIGTRNVVQCCLDFKVKRLLHFSSIHAFKSEPRAVPIDESRDAADPKAPPYDLSKAAGEREVLAGIAKGLDAVLVNPTGVIGPFDFGPSAMGDVFLQLYRREMPALVEGDFDWVDVRDVVQGAIAACEKGVAGERYILSGQRRSIPELAKLVEEITGKKAPRFVSPMWLARIGAPFAMLYAKAIGNRPLFTSRSLHAVRNHSAVTHEKAARELGHHPRPIEDTVKDTFAWFKDAGMLQ